jgi:hypothetical protein
MDRKISSLIPDYKAGRLSAGQVKELLNEMKEDDPRHPLSEGQKGLWLTGGRVILKKTHQ